MNRLKYIALSFVLISIFLLTDVTYAIPDVYCYENYVAGMTPFSVPSDTVIDEKGHWEQYNPIQNNLGLVTSYNNTSMSGAVPVTAVPSYDIDLKLGYTMRLPAGECVVLYSGSGANHGTIVSSSNLYCMNLGYTRATNNENDYMASVIDSTAFVYNSDFDLFQFSTQAMNVGELTSVYSSWNYYNSFNFGGLYSGAYQDGSAVILFYNSSSEPVDIYYRGNQGPYHEIDTLPLDEITWFLSAYSTYSSSTSYYGRYMLTLPHINGNFDLYTPVFSQGDTTTDYILKYSLDKRLTFDFGNADTTDDRTHYVPVTFPDSSLSTGVYGTIRAFFTDIPVGNLCPFFIHQQNATPYLYDKAIYIYDGYINIQNYDELIALLKEQGIGESDLTRVVELLTELNTGGASGEEVKELIDILEDYHQQLINQADFGTINNVFEQYKYILNFSDDMHWLITANNALFNYFSGFILLCALFLILNRILR